jgi:hypothetical protein
MIHLINDDVIQYFYDAILIIVIIFLRLGYVTFQ